MTGPSFPRRSSDMRNTKPGGAATLMAVLIFTAAAGAQPPGPPPPPGPGEPIQLSPTRISVEDVVQRILAFDKNKDGKVTKEELPERMRDLITRGDTNKDGALDKDEIEKLATAPGPGGFGTGATRIAGPGPGPGPGDAVRVAVEDLKLSGQKKE